MIPVIGATLASGASALASEAGALAGGVLTAGTLAKVGGALASGAGALTSLPIAGTLAAIAAGAVTLGCEEFKAVFNTLSNVFSEAVDNRIIRPAVTYSEIVQYLRQIRKDYPLVNKAVLLKQEDNERAAYQLYLICLNAKDEMLKDKIGNIIGRQYTCKNLDSDLVNIMDGKDVVIFQ